MNYNDIERIIGLAKSGDYKVCAWGTGYVGTHYGYEVVRGLGVHIDFYCDNNEQRYGKAIKDGIICINKDNIPQNVVCFILTSGHLIADITKQLTQMGINNIVNYMELCEYRSRLFYDFQKRNQIAVYTCVVGEYDEISEPEEVDDECDYYIISDQKPKRDTVYKYIDINDYIGKDITDNARKNRYCKVNAHRIFSHYRYSIYIDGNIILKGNIKWHINKLPKTRITTLAKTSYTSVYGEALRCMMHGRDDRIKFLDQVEKYWLQGMPEDFGLVIPAIMIREHNNPICSKIMDDWWNEINMYSKRDMISLSYVLWKNGYTINDISTLSNEPDVIDGAEWIFRRDHKKSRVKNNV